MEGRGRRRCKSRKPMVTASFFTFLFFSCLRSVNRSYVTYSVRWHHQARQGRFLWTIFCCICGVFVYFCDLPLAEARSGGKGTVMRYRRKRRQARRYATGCLTAAFSAGAHGKWWVTPNIFTPYLPGKASLISRGKKILVFHRLIWLFSVIWPNWIWCGWSKLKENSEEWEEEQRVSLFLFSELSLFLMCTYTQYVYVHTIYVRVQHFLPIRQNLYWYVCLD